jgi:hypothetical protein
MIGMRENLSFTGLLHWKRKLFEKIKKKYSKRKFLQKRLEG